VLISVVLGSLLIDLLRIETDPKGSDVNVKKHANSLIKTMRQVMLNSSFLAAGARTA
jgi:hypothetical protein